MIKSKLLILLLLISLIPLKHSGQVPVIDVLEILKENERVSIKSIYQDTSGYIWLGTNEGLFKFDGVNFEQFTQEDSLYSNQISAIGKAQKGFWVGHESGEITYFDGENFRKINPESGFSKQQISHIFERDKVLWFATMGEGVYYYKGEKRKRMYNLNTDDGLLDNYVYKILPAPSGLFYMATDRGISVYDPEKNEFIDKINSKDGLPDNLVKDLEIEEDILWVAMEDRGICKYDINNKKVTPITGWQFGAINDFEKYEQNKFWVSTKRNGLIKAQINKNHELSITGIDKKHGLPSKRLNTLFLDLEGNLWIGTKHGLAINRNNQIEFFNASTDFDIKNVFSLTKDKNGKFWIASQDGLHTFFKKSNGNYHLKKWFTGPAYENIAFVSVCQDQRNYIWVGTYGFGVFKINPDNGNFKQYKKEDGLSNNNIIHITCHKNNIYFATLGGGVSKLELQKDGHAFSTISTSNGLKSDYVYATMYDSQNRLWIATDGGGIAKMEDGKLTHPESKLIDSIGKVVYSITEDTKGNIWFGLADKGVLRYDGENFKHLSKENGLSSNEVKSIISYPDSHVLMTHNDDIDIVNESNFSITKIGSMLGLNNFMPSLNAYYRDSNQNLYIGSASGILKVNLQKEELSLKPKLFISKKELYYEPIKKGAHNFSHSQNNLTFQYTALWYLAASELMYRYKLENYDMKWSTPTSTRAVTYSFLPPGDYTFIVQVKMPNGEWYDNSDSRYSFTIKPPFWQTTWFIILAILVTILGIYAVIKYRTKKLQKDKENLERIVAQRTSEILTQKEEIESQRDEIERQRDYVTEQKSKIEKQNEHITDSIQYASRIQTAVLPPKENFKKLIGDYFIFFKPRDIVSGDFYYLNKSGNRIIVAAADCTGHGVPGAFMSLLGITFLNQITSQLPADFNAATVLNMLRNEVKKALRQTGKKDESKDGMDISMCVVDKDAQKLSYAGAYNPLLIARNKEELIYKADRMPIGIHLKDKADFTNHEVELQKNDMLFLYSDGFQDQFGGENKTKFLSKRFRKVLIEGSDLPTEKQETRLEKVFMDWKQKQPQIDDVIVMGIRV